MNEQPFPPPTLPAEALPIGALNDDIFPHECLADGCEARLMYDDEPYCFKHSPDSGSSVPGWSARRGLGGKAGK